jgi:hypothetical protein
MKTFYASALALSVAATGAFAESHSMSSDDAAATTAPAETTMSADASTGDMSGDAKYIRSRDITGGTIYTMNEANDEGSMWDMEYSEVGADWNAIGEIEDIVLSADGQMVGVVAEVGGFLDIGDKHVMLELENVKLVPVDDVSYAIVTRYNEEQLEEMQDIDEGFWN